MVRRKIFDRFEGKQKGAQIFETGEATPTKIGLHVFHINLYLHEYFEPILFLTPWTLRTAISIPVIAFVHVKSLTKAEIYTKTILPKVKHGKRKH